MRIISMNVIGLVERPGSNLIGGETPRLTLWESEFFGSFFVVKSRGSGVFEFKITDALLGLLLVTFFIGFKIFEYILIKMKGKVFNLEK